MSTAVVRIRSVEDRLKEWNFPLYPINRRINRTRVASDKIPVIQGRKLRVEGKGTEESNCLFCHKVSNAGRSRPSSAAGCSQRKTSTNNVLVHPDMIRQSLSLNHVQRFNENRHIIGKRRDYRPMKTPSGSGRRSPLAMECLQTNLNNHMLIRTQYPSTQVTILDDRSLNRTTSLPILLEKKSVEIKPRYEPKRKPTRRATPAPEDEASKEPPEPKPPSAGSTTQDGKSTAGSAYIDHSISVVITDRRTKAIVRASSASHLRPRPPF